MFEIGLLAGKLLLLALLYLFLFAAFKAGFGMVSGRSTTVAGERELSLAVTSGPKELLGMKLPIRGPIVIGRSPGADIVIADDFVSARHARIAPARGGATIEDLGSTNGTIVDGHLVRGLVPVSVGSVIELGTVKLRIES